MGSIGVKARDEQGLFASGKLSRNEGLWQVGGPALLQKSAAAPGPLRAVSFVCFVT
jgi:hypothetical protein